MKTAATVTLRPARSEDEAFLFEIYASTRQEDFASLPWDKQQRDIFLRLQFSAQQKSYESRYPRSGHSIVMLDQRPVGRIWVEKGDEEFRIIDIAFLPEHRSLGIGTLLLQQLLAEAGRAGKPLRLTVLKCNARAVMLYQRLGFSVLHDDGICISMTSGEPSINLPAL
ncbi:MAG: GNAT family N-acetyltransferase [Gammaproteobacteria bacterium]